MPVIKHTINSDAEPSPREIAVGELVLSLKNEKAVLYTKDFTGKVIEIGKGVTKLDELEDLDISTAREGDFLVKQGNKFVSASQIGNLNRLSDVEIKNPLDGQYLRYDPIKEAYVNEYPDYALSQLTDVDLTGLGSNNVLYWDAALNKWKPRARLNLVNELDDVELVPTAGTPEDPHRYQILSLDENGTIWSNQDLSIVRDTSPTLGGNLNANGNYFYNSFNNIGRVVANSSTVNLSYAVADYWVVIGLPVENQSQSILIPQITPSLNQVGVMLIEIRQNTGQILIGGLTNVKYEDGKAIRLSGAGKTDLITITVQNVEGEVTTYVTATALNLSSIGQGGLPSWRYEIVDNQAQLLASPNLYDDYFSYVKLLLDFESQDWKNKQWYEDKSLHNHPINIIGVTQEDTDIFTFGIQNKIVEFDNSIDFVNIAPITPIQVSGDFTFEFYLQYKDANLYQPLTVVSHKYFDSEDFKVIYSGQLNQNLSLEVIIGNDSFQFDNANRLFKYQNNRYIFFSITRISSTIKVHCDGEILTEKNNKTTNSPITNFSINSGQINIIGRMDSVRLTVGKGRYSQNIYQPPAMRFGRIGGLSGVIESQSFNYFHRSIGNQIFS